MTSSLAFVLVIICLLSEPCTLWCHPTSWYTLRGDNQRSGVVWVSSAGLTKLSTPPTGLKWNVRTSPNSLNCSNCADPYDPSPIFFKDASSSLSFVVVAHSTRFASISNLLARNPEDGSIVYNTSLRGWIDSDSASGSFLDDGSVIITHRSGVERISNNGKSLWYFQLNDELSPPTVTSSGLVIVSQGLCGGMFALDVNTGKQKWGTPITGQGFCSNPYLSLDEKTIWITTTTTFQFTAFWFSIDTETGHLQEKGQFPDIGNPEIGFERSNAISSQSDATFFMSYNQGDQSCWPYCDPNPQIFQLNSNTGANLPSFHLPLDFGGPIDEIAFSTFNGILYISNEQGDLLAVDPTGGKILWTAHCPCTGSCTSQPYFFDESYRTFFSPIIAATNGNTKGVIITGLGNQICAIDTSGKSLWNYSLPNYLFQQPAVSPDGIIYASTLTLEHGSFILAL